MMLHEMLGKRIAILLTQHSSTHSVVMAVISGTVRAGDTGFVLDRGPAKDPLTIDEAMLKRFRAPPPFMRFLFADAELVLAMRVSRLPSDADCLVPFFFGFAKPSVN